MWYMVRGQVRKIDLFGKVVRMQNEGEMWRIAIDLTDIYRLDNLRKV